MPRLIMRLIKTIAVVIGLISITGFRFYWLNEDYIVTAFEEIALKSEYREGVNEPVHKWIKPIKIFIDSRIGYKDIQTRLVDAHIATINQVITHPISRVNNRQDANMVILFEHSSKAYDSVKEIYPKKPFSKKRLKESLCSLRIHTVSHGEIDRAFILIPPDKARARGKLPACVVEEVTQALGLPNDSEKVHPSVFNDKSTDTVLSPLDKLLLKILYDKRVKAGMSREEVLPIVRTIARENIPSLKKRYQHIIRYENSIEY